MKVLEKTRLALIKDLEKRLNDPRITVFQRYNILETIALYKRMIKIDKLNEERLRPQLLKTKKRVKK